MFTGGNQCISVKKHKKTPKKTHTQTTKNIFKKRPKKHPNVPPNGNRKPCKQARKETNIKQKVINTIPNEKLNELIDQIDQRKGSILIFAKTKIGVDKLVKKLKASSIKANALHGGMRQNKRSKIMQNFRDERFRILVATDIASRGLDVPHIEHIINYDMPQAPEDFIHRIGRTARAGSVGEAVSFLTQKDTRIWRSIERLLNKEKSKRKIGNSKNENTPKFKNKRRRRSRTKKKVGGRN